MIELDIEMMIEFATNCDLMIIFLLFQDTWPHSNGPSESGGCRTLILLQVCIPSFLLHKFVVVACPQDFNTEFKNSFQLAKLVS